MSYTYFYYVQVTNNHEKREPHEVFIQQYFPRDRSLLFLLEGLPRLSTLLLVQNQNTDLKNVFHQIQNTKDYSAATPAHIFVAVR